MSAGDKEVTVYVLGGTPERGVTHGDEYHADARDTGGARAFPLKLSTQNAPGWERLNGSGLKSHGLSLRRIQRDLGISLDGVYVDTSDVEKIRGFATVIRGSCRPLFESMGLAVAIGVTALRDDRLEERDLEALTRSAFSGVWQRGAKLGRVAGWYSKIVAAAQLAADHYIDCFHVYFAAGSLPAKVKRVTGTTADPALIGERHGPDLNFEYRDSSRSTSLVTVYTKEKDSFSDVYHDLFRRRPPAPTPAVVPAQHAPWSVVLTAVAALVALAAVLARPSPPIIVQIPGPRPVDMVDAGRAAGQGSLAVQPTAQGAASSSDAGAVAGSDPPDVPKTPRLRQDETVESGPDPARGTSKKEGTVRHNPDVRLPVDGTTTATNNLVEAPPRIAAVSMTSPVISGFQDSRNPGWQRIADKLEQSIAGEAEVVRISPQENAEGLVAHVELTCVGASRGRPLYFDATPRTEEEMRRWIEQESRRLCGSTH